ncbi:MAG: aspartate kinase [Muribaculaceae bacterium]|nr:aspartate kinase [Muribaculaceae bacterium]
MKVLKFGGTSVGSEKSLANVKKIIEEIPGKALIVVSALGGLTDKLISTSEMAAEGNPDWSKEMSDIKERHHRIIDNMVDHSKRDELYPEIDRLLDLLENKYEEVYKTKELNEKSLDYIVSFGERLSSLIVAAMVKNGKRYYSPDFIKTEKWYGKNIISAKVTESLIKEKFENLGEGEKCIIPGFISTDFHTGEITNLGRGGSDYTGALIAAALDAEVLEIWTDVDGFMTADPRIVKDALIIDHLTFTESMELCTFGAKVVYPPTIYPVFHKNIPIKILNTFNPTAPGTIITESHRPEDFDVKGVTSHNNLALITIDVIERDSLLSMGRMISDILSKNGVSIIPLENDYEKIHYGINESDVDKVTEILDTQLQPYIEQRKISIPQLQKNMAAIALVGRDMKNRGRLVARLKNSLEREGIGVMAIANMSSTTIIMMIEQESASDALNIIHSLIY